MKVIEGVITMLGNAKIKTGAVNSFTTYSLIEVDGQVIKNAIINNKLDNFLERAHRGGNRVRLTIIKPSVIHNGIAAIEFEDGTKYLSAPYSTPLMYVWIGLVLMFGLFGLSLGTWVPFGVVIVGAVVVAGRPALGFMKAKGQGGTVL